MQDNGGIKRNGRFIKKDSSTLKNIRVSNFDFAEICEADVIYPDNANLNIIHSKLHIPEELDVIRNSPIDINLSDSKVHLPVMTLRDFTKDWIDHKIKMKNRKNKMSDDDEDIESIFSEKQLEQTNVDDEVSMMMRNSSSMGNINQSFDTAKSNDIKPQNFALTNDEDNITETNQNFDLDANEPVDLNQQVEEDIEQENLLASGEASSPTEDNFYPISTSNFDKNSITNVEQNAINEYHQQKEIDAIDVEAIKEEAKAIGYEEGFRSGEERAIIESKQKNQEMFSKVGELMNEFENLKKGIFENVQDNFHEIAQAMCEAIIERSINLDPSIFADIISRAINESVEDESFKVIVNPETEKLLKNLKIQSLENKIFSSSNIEKGNFKIETNLGSVSSGIKKIITDLLNQANIDLFDNDQHDKAV